MGGHHHRAEKRPFASIAKVLRANVYSDSYTDIFIIMISAFFYYDRIVSRIAILMPIGTNK